ncbi:MAG: transposase IS200-like protein [Bacteroidetes bacterium]|nr:transposase IS200-like protein [Bacteroidota bacterium]
MSSYRQVLYHIVFRTKDSLKTLNLENSEELYKYIWGIVKGKNGVLYRINGMEDHIHILSDLHPSIALSDYLRDIKTASSIWLKQSGKFQSFNGWADGYAAFTYAYRDKETIINYIKNQREHHKTTTFEEELRKLLTEHGVEINEKFFL